MLGPSLTYLMGKRHTGKIRQRLLHLAALRRPSLISAVARELDVSEEAVRKHARRLRNAQLLRMEGAGPGTHYSLVPLAETTSTVSVTASLEEHVAWAEFAEPFLAGHVSESEEYLCHYGFTEMVNNVIDHSNASTVVMHIARAEKSVHLAVKDDGVGIFHKIATALGLPDPRQSILELSKGKLTTDPKRHTGEGIFFTSRMFDSFCIRSGNLYYIHEEGRQDFLFEHGEPQVGTAVFMDLLLPCDRDQRAVFEEFTSGDDAPLAFSKTCVPLKLAALGSTSLVSRSQARRVMARVQHFEDVLLDFAGIRRIGQGFADEVFRVFSNEHPAVRMTVANANDAVRAVIAHVRRSTTSQGDLFPDE